MAKVMRAGDIIEECGSLAKFWNTRNRQFERWYDILLLTNNLKQEEMESVISNDPRTAYDLAMRLLTSSTIAHKIPLEGLNKADIGATSYLERYVDTHWNRIEKKHRRMGRQSWLREFIGFMLAIGWYSIFAWATNTDLIAEIWNPANVYPEFDNEIGLTKCVHIYTIGAEAANRKARSSGWSLKYPIKTQTKLYNYWKIDEFGMVANAIVLGTNLVKPLTPLTKSEQFADIIPIFVSPIGGLPDRGAIKSSMDWQNHCGESIIAVNAEEYNNHNKLLTFAQQLVRDTANPRWFEQTRSSQGILQPETIFKRGAIFRGTPDENVTALPMPAIPIELRTLAFDYDNRIQRGSFSWALAGNIQQQMSGYLLSQIAATAIGIIAPYVKGLSVLSDVDNYWYQEIKNRHLNMYGFKMPANIPDDIEFQVDCNINVPGSIVQKATLARMLDPTFELDFATTADMLFPEIKDPVAVQAKVNRDRAMTNEIAQMLALVSAYREEAAIYKEAKDTVTADLFTKAADAIQAQIGLAPTRPAGGAEKPVTPSREVMPKEEITPTETLGAKAGYGV